MNDLETGYNSTTCRDTQPLQEEDTPAPATVYGRQESDESYEGVISREGDLRIVNCPDDIQWIAQRRTGGRWRNKSFHRTRRSLIQRYGPLEMILALPEHYDRTRLLAGRRLDRLLIERRERQWHGTRCRPSDASPQRVG